MLVIQRHHVVTIAGTLRQYLRQPQRLSMNEGIQKRTRIGESEHETGRKRQRRTTRAASLHRHFCFFGVYQHLQSASQANPTPTVVHLHLLLSTGLTVNVDLGDTDYRPVCSKAVLQKLTGETIGVKPRF